MFKRLPISFAVCLFCSAVIASANEGTSEADSLPAVSVTATGYESMLIDTPSSVVVLSESDIANLQAQNVADALEFESGISVSRDSAQGQNPVIRGLGKENIVLLVNGMRLNSAQPAGSVSSSMSFGLAERVEVVKGPASVLYGTGALGGAINVILPRARFVKGFSGKYSLGFDSALHGGFGSFVGNFSDGNHALMLGAALADFSDYSAPRVSRVPRTGYGSKAFVGQYRFRIDESRSFGFSLQNQVDSDIWYAGSTRGHRVPAVSSITIHSPKQKRNLYELFYSDSRGAGRDFGFDLRLYRQEMHRSIYAYANGLGRDIVSTNVVFATDGFDARGEFLRGNHLLSFGLNAWQMKASPNRLSANPPTFSTFVRNVPFENGFLRAIGFYLQDDLQFGKWHVIAGLRRDRVSGGALSMGNGAVTSGLSRSDGANSGSIGLIYEASAIFRPYLNLSRGFRAADLRERFESGLRNDGSFYAGNPQISPEKATQIELGVKGANEVFDYQAAIYQNKISNYITGSSLSGAQAVAACGAMNAAFCKRNSNLGSVMLRGVDLSFAWNFSAGHKMSFVYSRVRGTNRDLGEPLYQMPADTLSIGLSSVLAKGLTLDLAGHFVKRQTRVARIFSRGSENETAGYSVFNAGLNWEIGKDRNLRVAIKNLGNKSYHSHLTQGISGTEIPAVGRSLAVSFNSKF